MSTHLEPHSIWRRVREIAVVLCMGLLVGVILYLSHDTQGVLSGLRTSAEGKELAVPTTFSTAFLSDREIFDLTLDTKGDKAEQLSAVFHDPNVPSPATEVSVRNTRVGNELALFWTPPPENPLVNIYRQIGPWNPLSVGDRIASHVSGTTYIDTNLRDGTRYSYNIVPLIDIEGKEVESATPALDSAIPQDEIAPSSPAAVTIRTSTSAAKTGLSIAWENPPESDLAVVVIYRSDVRGVIGTEIGRVPASDPPQFLDAVVIANQTYYYTVVALDTAGNASADTLQIPPAGNPTPFTPRALTENNDQAP